MKRKKVCKQEVVLTPDPQRPSHPSSPIPLLAGSSALGSLRRHCDAGFRQKTVISSLLAPTTEAVGDGHRVDGTACGEIGVRETAVDVKHRKAHRKLRRLSRSWDTRFRRRGW